jgi:hypothetical protein
LRLLPRPHTNSLVLTRYHALLPREEARGCRPRLLPHTIRTPSRCGQKREQWRRNCLAALSYLSITRPMLGRRTSQPLLHCLRRRERLAGLRLSRSTRRLLPRHWWCRRLAVHACDELTRSPCGGVAHISHGSQLASKSWSTCSRVSLLVPLFLGLCWRNVAGG